MIFGIILPIATTVISMMLGFALEGVGSVVSTILCLNPIAIIVGLIIIICIKKKRKTQTT